MGGNSGFYYGQKVIAEDSDVIDETFYLGEIETDVLPNLNDLILNEPNGCFYRVTAILDEDSIQATKLTVAGSGGGGGGGSSVGTAIIDRITEQNVQALSGNPCFIQYKLTATDGSGDAISYSGEATWKIGGVVVDRNVAFIGNNSYDISKYLKLGRNDITLQISIDTGGSSNTIVKKTWTVTVVSLGLIWDYNPAQINQKGQITLFFTPIGSIKKWLHIIIDEEYELPLESYSTSGTVQNYSVIHESLTHGAHKIELYLSADLENGTSIRTDSIIYDCIFIDENDTTPIIASNFNITSMSQFETIQIPFTVYVKDKEINDVSFYVDENFVTSIKADRTLQSISYTPVDYGFKTFKFVVGSISKTFPEITVKEIDLGIKEEPGYAFRLKASDFSSNENLKEWNSNGVTLSFSDNFDWDNGGIQHEVNEDGTVSQFICIKNGSRMTINYPLFGNEGKTNGKNFKIIFKATRCYNYDAKFLDCTSMVGTRETGLQMNAQSAKFTSRETSIITQYCENSYIDYELDIFRVGDTDHRYIMNWLDGVPCGVTRYSTADSFQLGNSKITIGSDECDVYIYLVRTYEKYINETSHLNHFILDAPTALEMKDRFDRNDILNEADEIDYLKLAEANPRCHVHVYEIDRMTTGKKDKVSNCKYQQYYQTADKPILQAEGVEMKVQGTSSASYGLSAFNFKSEFKKGFIDKDGSQIQEWAMTENSMPAKLFTTKVNVASCEGANNAINAEWYNKFQPYICDYRNKNSKARDTMEFQPGVVFIKDNNPLTKTDIDNDPNKSLINANVFFDTPGYIINTGEKDEKGDPIYEGAYYKMYAIGCMGNDKGNFEVFHDITNDKELCIEVTDNQTAGQWMTVTQGYELQTYIDEKGEKKEKMVPVPIDSIDTPENYLKWKEAMNDNAYDVRYAGNASDGVDNCSEEKIRAFFRLVNWMSKCNLQPYSKEKNPNGYTNELLPEPITFEPFVLSGNKYSSVLGKTTITKYANTYERDTKEYRIAKMLSECEDYLIMDSIIYHYLFIERHSMVDNVAKNTFWSTEDLVHWSLIKDYDNDTSDGNDNEGNLTLTYGIEPSDKKIVGNKEVSYFNAEQSVWFNFAMELTDLQKKMYVNLKNRGAWSSTDYLNDFKKFQQAIPERCWIADYFRKYIRPDKFGEAMYLSMLEGGLKTHQRKQYEIYQNAYIDSKYVMDGDNLLIRSEATDFLEGQKIIITPYHDCYISAMFGSRIDFQRAKKNEPIELTIEMDNASDATCKIFHPQTISILGDISPLTPEEIGGLNLCDKLRSIKIGSEDKINTYLNTISFQNNTMLENIDIQGCQSDKLGALDLSDLKSLKTLNASRSLFTSYIFPNNGMLKSAKIGSPTNISMSNLKYLEDENFIIDDYSKIIALNINNCKIDSLKLLNNSEHLVNYKFTDIDWITSEITLDNSNYVNEINLLKRLNELSPYENTYSKADCLTGKLTIKPEENCSINELNLYKKYIDNENGFKNLTLKYDVSSSDVDINFEATKTYVFYDANGAKLAELKANEEKDGVPSAFKEEDLRKIITPLKAEDKQYTYEFMGWEVRNADTNEVAYELLSMEDIISSIRVALFNYNFIPQYNAIIRKYPIIYRYTDGTIIESTEQDYGTLIRKPSIIPYQEIPDTEENFYYVNRFLGYSTTQDGKENNLFDFTGKIVSKGMTFYTVFKKVEVHDNVIPFEYLDFGTRWNDINKTGTYTFNKSKYSSYKGKITLPTQIIRNNEIYSITPFSNAFQDMSEITHVFWENKNNSIENFTAISPSCFYNCASLKFIEPLPNLREIGGSSFNNCKKLFQDMTEDQIRDFFKNVSKIGQFAFTSSFSNTTGNLVITLSDNINMLGSGCFGSIASMNNNVNITVNINISNILDFKDFNSNAFNGANIKNFNIVASLKAKADEFIDKMSLREIPNITINTTLL